ncbi:MAG: hypothetical protein RSA92_02160 [Bacteroidaceae bacterium]
MKSLLKYLGIILIVIGSIILAVSFSMGATNNNVILGGSLALIVAGLISYIIINKKITE